MTQPSFLFAVLLTLCTITNACSQSPGKPSTIVLVASTPCDSVIKSLLQIPQTTTCDFIRWDLTLRKEGGDANRFVLNIVYGEGQPNTPGFKGGGEKRSFKGTYSILQNKNESKTEVYQLKIENSFTSISLIKLNDNLFHLLTPSGKFMVGNGGWSYTLNRKELIKTTNALPVLMTSATTYDTLSQVIYDGRTPCQSFATDHQMNVSSSCIKLKWRLILNRDPVSHKPTTYTIRKVVDNLPADVSGKWKMIRGIPGNPDAIIYKLDPNDPGKSISFFAVDENVLFFLDIDYKLYTGNSDFSFTLNRKQL